MVNRRKFNDHRVREVLTSEKGGESIGTGRVDVDDGGVKDDGCIVCSAMTNEAISKRGFPQVHHFWVVDDGLLPGLAVSSVYAEIVSVVCAGTTSIDVVSHQIA